MPDRKNKLRQRARRRITAAKSDIRGVALQTVIVIVVLLVIAGSVSAVLLSRSSDVVRSLEDQAIGGITADSCPITRIGGQNGQVGKVDSVNSADDSVCWWGAYESDGTTKATESDFSDSHNISAGQCAAAAGGMLVLAVAADSPGAVVVCAAEIA